MEEIKKQLKGHKQMIVWQSIDQLDIIVQKVLRGIPKFEFKMKSQINNAVDSVGANFVEGYYSLSIKEYIRFLKYSRRSLGELQDRVWRLLRKGFVNKKEYYEFEDRVMKTMYLLDRLKLSLENKLVDN